MVSAFLIPILVHSVFASPAVIQDILKATSINKNADLCKTLIIAHRGASGYVPEHTLGSYALAITMGADYVEPDLVMTKDGHLVARHENSIETTTDVSDRSEFLSRRRTKKVDGTEIDGWFTEDFTLKELKTLRAKERIPINRPGNARMDKSFQIPTFQEIIDLVKSMEISQRRTIGIYPEIKHSSYFKGLGLPMEQLLIDTLHENGYTGTNAPIYIQSFEVTNLKELRKLTDLRLLQLLDSKKMIPFDQIEMGTERTYGDMSTADGLKEISKYADAVGPDKLYIIPRDENNHLGKVTTFVHDAHAAGLKVHPYTFRAENTFLPAEFRSDDNVSYAIGDLKKEIQAYLDTGIDGLFSDQPDIAFKVRGSC